MANWYRDGECWSFDTFLCATWPPQQRRPQWWIHWSSRCRTLLSVHTEAPEQFGSITESPTNVQSGSGEANYSQHLRRKKRWILNLVGVERMISEKNRLFSQNFETWFLSWNISCLKRTLVFQRENPKINSMLNVSVAAFYASKLQSVENCCTEQSTTVKYQPFSQKNGRKMNKGLMMKQKQGWW